MVRRLALLVVLVSCGGDDTSAMEDAGVDTGVGDDTGLTDDSGADADAGAADVGVPEPITEPSVVTADGRRLLVDGEPYEIRGTCWSPVPRGERVPVNWTGTLARDDVPLMAAAGINTVRTYSPIDSLPLLDALAAVGIRVIQSVHAVGSAPTSDALALVEAQKDHPAILMWELGNEWNYNRLYSDLSIEEIETRLEALAQMIHAIDPDHLVSTSHGEMPSAERLAAMPSIDVWGLNVYRGRSFFGLLAQWQMTDERPMYLAEYGADAFDSRVGEENIEAHAMAVGALTEELVAQSTARSPLGIVAGGTIFEWSDEWWKDEAGDPNVHDTGGFAPGGGPPPDMTFNEEWWGLVDIDRNPRPALEVFTATWLR